jgi:hypothetical protein
MDLLLIAPTNGLSTKLRQALYKIKHFTHFSTHPAEVNTAPQVIDA